MLSENYMREQFTVQAREKEPMKPSNCTLPRFIEKHFSSISNQQWINSTCRKIYVQFLLRRSLPQLGQPAKIYGKLMVIQFHFQKHLHSTLVEVLLNPVRQIPKSMEIECLTEDSGVVFWCRPYWQVQWPRLSAYNLHLIPQSRIGQDKFSFGN